MMPPCVHVDRDIRREVSSAPYSCQPIDGFTKEDESWLSCSSSDPTQKSNALITPLLAESDLEVEGGANKEE